MGSGRLIALLLVFLLASGISAYAEVVGSSSPEKIMEAAAEGIDEGELDLSIEKLNGIQKEGLSVDGLSRLHFLMGKVKYIKVVTDIRAYRSEGTQKRSELQDHQVEPLKIALDHFETSYDLSPESDWAPEALYATGLIQDFGGLQRFEDAAKTYRVIAEKFPDTNLGKVAAQKYEDLNSRLQGKGHGTAHP